LTKSYRPQLSQKNSAEIWFGGRSGDGVSGGGVSRGISSVGGVSEGVLSGVDVAGGVLSGVGVSPGEVLGDVVAVPPTVGPSSPPDLNKSVRKNSPQNASASTTTMAAIGIQIFTFFFSRLGGGACAGPGVVSDIPQAAQNASPSSVCFPQFLQ